MINIPEVVNYDAVELYWVIQRGAPNDNSCKRDEHLSVCPSTVQQQHKLKPLKWHVGNSLWWYSGEENRREGKTKSAMNTSNCKKRTQPLELITSNVHLHALYIGSKISEWSEVYFLTSPSASPENRVAKPKITYDPQTGIPSLSVM